jgi:hypothetical protein
MMNGLASAKGLKMRRIVVMAVVVFLWISALPGLAQAVTVEAVDVDGATHILRAGAARQVVSPLVREAIGRSVSYYSTLWGALDFTLFVDLVDEQGPDLGGGRRPDAETNYRDSLDVPQPGGGTRATNKVCEVTLYNVDATLGPQEVRFIAAHEIAHCFQERFKGSLSNEQYQRSLWWVEGTANWMASLVYPPSTAPTFWGSSNQDFVTNLGVRSLPGTSYDNSFFFQALSRQVSLEATMTFINGIPANPDSHETYLRDYFGNDEFTNLFSTYALMVGQGVLRGLPDQGALWGKNVIAAAAASAGHVLTVPRLGFNLYTFNLAGLAAGQGVDMVVSIPEGVNARAQLADGTQIASTTPIKVCPADGAIRMIVSRGFGDVGGDFEVAFNPSPEPCVPTPTPAVSTTGTPDCLLGNWTLFRMPDAPTSGPEAEAYQMTPGNSGLTFTPGGHVELRFDGLVVRNYGPMKELIIFRMGGVIVRGVANFAPGADASTYVATYVSGRRIGQARMTMQVAGTITNLSATLERALGMGGGGGAGLGRFTFRCVDGDMLEYVVEAGGARVVYLYSR